MHRCHGHENAEAPCNIYCDGDVHCDMVYVHRDDLRMHGTLDDFFHAFCARIMIASGAQYLRHTPAPEAMSPRGYYPSTWHAGGNLPDDAYQACRVWYRFGA